MAGQASRMVKTGFAGFPAEGMQFFRSLARNNRREWFQPRKQIYDDQLKAPMMELVTALNAEMMRFAPNYVAEPAKAIYRLYRDTRFSKDKTPYKTHIAAIFPRRGLVKHEGAGGKTGGISRVLDLYRSRLHLYESFYPASRFYLRPLLFVRHLIELGWFALVALFKNEPRLPMRIEMVKGVLKGYR